MAVFDIRKVSKVLVRCKECGRTTQVNLETRTIDRWAVCAECSCGLKWLEPGGGFNLIPFLLQTLRAWPDADIHLAVEEQNMT